MSELLATDATAYVVGAASLLGCKEMHYVDGYETLLVGAGRSGIEFPKDGHTDAFRFVEALQEKLPRGARGLFVEVLPVPLESKIGSELPYAYNEFVEAWYASTPKVTTVRWGDCYQTRASSYIRGDDVLKLDLDNFDHYYNIVMSRNERSKFEPVNPGFDYELCDDPCVPMIGRFVHFHAVHGCYKGSEVNGVYCAPPFRLCPEWAEVPHFTVEELGGIGLPSCGGVGGDTASAAVRAVDFDSLGKLGVGAATLAAFCYEGGHLAAWDALCQAYRTPESAHWASTVACAPTLAGQNKIKRRWNAVFHEEILPLLRGRGAPIPIVLQRVWSVDSTSSKTLASYFMRRLFSGQSHVAFTASRTLRI